MIFKKQFSVGLLCSALLPAAVAHDLVDPMMPQLPKAKAKAIATPPKTVVVKPTLPSLRLDAVTIIGDFKVAFINGVRLLPGDSIQGAILSDIGASWVMVIFDNELYRIDRHRAQAIIVPAANSSEESQ